MQSCTTLFERRFEAGEYGIELVTERLAVVVVAAVPLLHDPPDRAGLGALPGAGRMRRDPQHPHPLSHRALQESPGVGGNRLLGPRRAVHAGRKLCPPTRMVVDRVDVQVRLEPSRPGDVPGPPGGISSHEGHPDLPRCEIVADVPEPSRIARETRWLKSKECAGSERERSRCRRAARIGKHGCRRVTVVADHQRHPFRRRRQARECWQGSHPRQRRCGQAGFAQIRVQIRVGSHCAHHLRSLCLYRPAPQSTNPCRHETSA